MVKYLRIFCTTDSCSNLSMSTVATRNHLRAKKKVPIVQRNLPTICSAGRRMTEVTVTEATAIRRVDHLAAGLGQTVAVTAALREPQVHPGVC